jgi:hypothetical protein
MKLYNLVFLLTIFLLSCMKSVPIYQTEASVGTFSQQIASNSPDVRIGTGFVIKIRSLQLERPHNIARISIRGPSNWNSDQPLQVNYPANAYWLVISRADLPPIVGDYQIESVIDNQKSQSKVTISSQNLILPISTIESQAFSENSISKIVVKWNKVTDAVSYYGRVMDITRGIPISDDFYTHELTTIFAVPILNPNRAYSVVLLSANFDTVIDEPVLPTVLLLSDSVQNIDNPTQPQKVVTNSFTTRSSSITFSR